MKETILLTKVLFKSSVMQAKDDKKKIGKILLYAFAFLYLFGAVFYVSYNAISSLILINQEIVFLNLCFFGLFFMSVIQTVITSLNVMFFSKDLEILLPLPITPIKIVMSKFNSLILSQYIISTILILPVLIVYGILLKLNLLFYVVGILVMLLFPIVPVIITSFITIIIMKFTNIIKNKEVVQYLSVVVTLILVISLQFFMLGNQDDITNEEIANNLVQVDGISQNYSKFIVTLAPSINSIINYNNINGIINLGILFIETVVTYLLISFITSKIYIKTAISVSSNGIKTKRKLKKDKMYVQRKVFMSYLGKEWKMLNRNPIFFMQCVLPAMIFPLIFAIPFVISLKDLDQNAIQTVKSLLLKIDLNTQPFFTIILCIICFFFMFNFASVTAISRDAENSTFMKYIPVKVESQILYKILPGVILNMLPIIYVIGGLAIFIKLPIKIVFYIIIVSTLINILNNLLMIFVDLKNPKLKWITEYAVVKQNFNMFYEIVLVFLELGLLYFLSVKIYSIDLYVITLVVLFTILNILLYKYIGKNKSKILSKIN